MLVINSHRSTNQKYYKKEGGSFYMMNLASVVVSKQSVWARLQVAA